MNADLLKRYNDEAESCLSKFKELVNIDPDKADKYYLKAGVWIGKAKQLIRST
ncbi:MULTISPECIES: hypothetical protein [Methanobacterium]|uniref:hypothetical protein n=1 Tax=Methanobacterium TaxID=2160 RepID=UPI00159F04F5|nr:MULTISPECIES: hypothetical protein [Methanobacterium]